MSAGADRARPAAVTEFLEALHGGDVGRVRELLEQHAEVRAVVNEPISHFDSRPVARATTNLPLLDLLLQYGADLNLKSAWWAGGFGLLEHGLSAEEAAPLIARGAVVDVFAAAHLGMFDRLRALIESDPALVHARGGDGKTPLHCARTVPIAAYLLAQGAAIDARDVDHESTPAQYLIRDAPDVVRLLVDRGAWFDIFIAVGLHDATLVARCLREDPDALDHRIGQGLYTVAHDGRRAATAEEIGSRRGDTYRWVFGHNISAIDVAVLLGDQEIVQQLLDQASPAQRLLAACAAADRDTAEALVASHPGIVRNLRPDQMRLVADRAHANDTAAVALMAAVGFEMRATGPNQGTALHWASFHGNVAMVRLLLRHDPPVGVGDGDYHATPLGWCVYGVRNGWHRDTADYPATARLLLDAGERPKAGAVPTGDDQVDAALAPFL